MDLSETEKNFLREESTNNTAIKKYLPKLNS